jgi:hypothetical protein
MMCAHPEQSSRDSSASPATSRPVQGPAGRAKPVPRASVGPRLCLPRPRRGDLGKLLWSDEDGPCLLAKRLERGRFGCPKAESGQHPWPARGVSGTVWVMPLKELLATNTALSVEVFPRTFAARAADHRQAQGRSGLPETQPGRSSS